MVKPLFPKVTMYVVFQVPGIFSVNGGNSINAIKQGAFVTPI